MQELKMQSFNGKLYGPIPIHKLKIDPEYQRNLCDRVIEDNTADNVFNPQAIRTLVVSLRRDGNYYILDGQHRYEMILRRNTLARKNGGAVVDFMFCEVLQNLKKKDEAALFPILNNMKTVSRQDKFKANATAEDAHTLAIIKAVRLYGFEVQITRGRPPVGSQVIRAGTLERLWLKYAACAEDALRIIKKVYTIGGSGEVSHLARQDLFVLGFAHYLHLYGATVDVEEVIAAMQYGQPPAGQNAAEAFRRQVHDASNGAVRKDAVPAFAEEVRKKVEAYNRKMTGRKKAA